MKYLLEIYCGLPVSLSAPSVMTAYGASPDYSGALAVGISQSGAGIDVVEVVRRAAESGAVTAALTNTMSSPLAGACRYVLDCRAGEEVSVAATKTFTAELILSVLLACETSAALAGERLLADARLKELSEGISAAPGAVEHMLRREDEIEAFAEEFDGAEDCFVLARGLPYPIAMEIALKLQETSYIRAICRPASEFLHGPIAMISGGSRVLLLDADGKTRGDMRGLAEKLSLLGAKVSVITGAPEEYRRLPQINILSLPADLPALAACFATAAAGQLISCFISSKKGINPDTPRSLLKVTVTR